MKYILIIIFALNIWGCQKTEVAELQTSAGKREYEIKMWVNSSDAFIRYQIGDYFDKHPVNGHWDTTFLMESGKIMLTVTSFTYQMNCGVSIDGEPIFTDSLTDYAIFNHEIL